MFSIALLGAGTQVYAEDNDTVKEIFVILKNHETVIEVVLGDGHERYVLDAGDLDDALTYLLKVTDLNSSQIE